jgi:hypothetical protein
MSNKKGPKASGTGEYPVVKNNPARVISHLKTAPFSNDALKSAVDGVVKEVEVAAGVPNELKKEIPKVKIAKHEDMVGCFWFNSCSGLLENKDIPAIFVPMELPEEEVSSITKAFAASGFNRKDDNSPLFLFFPLNSAVVHPNVLICAAFASYISTHDGISNEAAMAIAMNNFMQCGAFPPIRLLRQGQIVLTPEKVVDIKIVLNDANADLENDFFPATMSAEEVTREMLGRLKKELGRDLTTEDFITFAKNNSMLLASVL